jgi:hypothetical protein
MFDFLIRWKIDSAFNNNKREHTFRNMESMHNILVFFSYGDWNEICSIAKELEQMGKKIVMWTVPPHKKDTDNIIFPTNVKVIRQNELSLLKILSTPVVEEFKSLSYDTLIDLTTIHSNALKYLLVQNSSDFCIGISKPEQKVYDFIILKEDGKNLKETYGQIKFYLSNVR